MDLPDDPGNVAQLQTAFDGQTGQLEKANAYKGASLEIIRRCEKRDRDVDAALKRKN